MTFFAFSALISHPTTYNVVENQFIYVADDLAEAEKIAENYDLELASFSDYGVAVYIIASIIQVTYWIMGSVLIPIL